MTNSKKERVLILGGAGFLGANLVRRCIEAGAQVTVVDSLDPISKSTLDSLTDVLPQLEFIQGDIRDEKLLAKVVKDRDIIFNCAAQTSHPYSLENPILDVEVNCIGTLKLLDAIKKHNPNAIVVFPSSSTVIGKAVGDVIDESHGEKPLDIYSANKGVAEKYYRIYNRVHDIKTIVVRFANLFGPYGKNDPAFGFVNYFIHLADQNQTIKIFGDGLQTRNVMYVEDATNILWHAAHNQRLIGESYFAAHHDHHTVAQIAEEIIRVFGAGSIEKTEWPDVRKRIEIDKVQISSARLHYLTDWRPEYDLSKGLQKTKSIMRNK